MIRTAKYTDAGGRKTNEDSCGIFESGKIVCAAVADGLGGHGGGDKASSMAIDLLGKQFLKARTDQPAAFYDWFQNINENVYRAQTTGCRMKTTLAALWTNGSRYFQAHVGDTRIYHFINEHLDSVTFDHSVSQMAVIRGEITQQEIRHHVDRGRLLRALGKEDEVKVEVFGPADITSGRHAFLLCTDGFWEYVLEEDMEETLREAELPEQWLRLMRARLCKRVKDQNDNNTAVAIWTNGGC